MLKEN